MGRCSRKLVLRLAAETIRRAREVCPLYASDAAPLHEGQLQDLIRQAGCAVEVFAFRSAAGAFAASVAGAPCIALNANATRDVRIFGARHELHHVLAGEVDHGAAGPVYFSDYGYGSPWERAADLFALADLVPPWVLRMQRTSSDQSLRRLVAENMGEYASGWPLRRVADRARLRVQLFRECGL